MIKTHLQSATVALFMAILLINNLFAQQVSVLTQRYDNKRLGWNNSESILTTSNVDTAHFGLLFRRSVDDQIYAQPLIVCGMQIGAGIRNVVFVATVNNSVYAFDADDSISGSPLWQINLTPPNCRVIRNTDMTNACGGNYFDFSGNMGIVGTPVIDTSTNTMYLVSRDIDTLTGNFEQYFHALDLFTGNEKPNSPVYIDAYYIGNGDGSFHDTIRFEEQKQNQRAALLLLNGVVYICWAAHCDWDPYHGWLIGYDASTLAKRCVYNDTPDGGEGGIWMSGAGPVVDDSGYIYLSTGNGQVGYGTADPNYYRDRGESLMKMLPSGDSMIVVDFFTPSNWQIMEADDLDYGVDGVLLIPNSTLSLSGSKEGKLYLVDNTHMGKCTPGNDSVLEVIYVNIQNIQDNHVHGTPVYYKFTNAGVDTEYVYAWAESDSLNQLYFNRSTGLFDTTITVKGDVLLDYGMPGSMLSVSSNGAIPGSGILWASHPTSGNANQHLRPGRLDAYDARNVKNMLWNSDMLANRDSIGTFSKFNTPVVANGKVYAATFSNNLNVYGILPYATGIKNSLQEHFSVSVFPNPAQKEITIDYNVLNAEEKLTMILTDVFGRKLQLTELNPSTGEHKEKCFLPSHLSAGVYQLMFVSDDNIYFVVKLVCY